MDNNIDFDAFFEQFAAAYSRLEVDGVMRFYALPFSTQITGEHNTWTEQNELRDTLTALYGWFGEQGFHNARYTIVDQNQINDKLASAKLNWHVTRNNGDEVRYFNTYQIELIDGEWKITCIHQSEEDMPEQ
ncbi:DUF6841 family protein [Andreprevotia chitinilytica]|uniref:DUF6841 family protein n=1 Tax=Andreprevotia chitinilytica TaxID=396808 RepID=UPI000552ABB5|nr:nuclear transport factor 2 family protein [Andreprevotia chitinilytica]